MRKLSGKIDKTKPEVIKFNSFGGSYKINLDRQSE